MVLAETSTLVRATSVRHEDEYESPSGDAKGVIVSGVVIAGDTALLLKDQKIVSYRKTPSTHEF